MSAIDDLKKARIILVEQRRGLVAKIVEGGEVARWAPGMFSTINWIDAVDRAIADEKKPASGDGAVAARSSRSHRQPAEA